MLRGLLVRVLVFLWLPVAFLWPFGGLLFYLWYSHFRPNYFIWPGYAFYQGALLITAATVLGYVLFEMPRSPLRWQGLRILTLFWVWIALATLLSTDPSASFEKLSQYTHIFVITFLIAAMANSESR